MLTIKSQYCRPDEVVIKTQVFVEFDADKIFKVDNRFKEINMSDLNGIIMVTLYIYIHISLLLCSQYLLLRVNFQVTILTTAYLTQLTHS